MNILVLNSGSSSLKFKLFDVDNNEMKSQGHIDGIGLESCTIEINESKQNKNISTHEEAINEIFNNVDLSSIKAIGHRVVHGGDKYSEATLINDEVINSIEEFSDLAPLHNPVNLIGIKACIDKNIPQVAVFDTAFHQTIEKKNYLYAIPKSLSDKYKLRKYGFHRTSHTFLCHEMQKILCKENVNLITCHLGNGASITAIKDGKVIDTSMGLTPLPGLVMGTRSGDIDPEIIQFLSKKENIDVSEIMNILNKKSGLFGVSGFSDMREVYNQANQGKEDAKLAIDVYAKRICFYISAYIGLLECFPDAIVFSAGTGQGAFYVREKVCKKLSHFKINLDYEKNNIGWISENTEISQNDSNIKVYVIPTNEELMIAKETEKVIKENGIY